MKIHDVTLTITPELVTWPGDPNVVLERVNKIEEGANANVSRMDMGVHTGTHVDAPVHFLPGQAGIETLDLNILVGPGRVIELPESVAVVDEIALSALDWSKPHTRVLFKTRNSQYWRAGDMTFHRDFVGINAAGAEFLVKQGVKLVGVDYLSVSPWKQSRPVHQTLLNNAVIIIEGLDLSAVSAGEYQLYCLPMKLGGSDGAPARVILVED